MTDLKNLKKIIKEMPVLSKVPIMIKDDKAYNIKALVEEKIEFKEEDRTKEEYSFLAEEYHKMLAEESPNERIITIDGLSINHTEATEQIRSKTETGKWLIEAYKKGILNHILRRIKE